MTKSVTGLVFLAACSFRPQAGATDGARGSDAALDGAIDAAIDAHPDTPSESCLARWHDGTVHFDAPVSLAALGTGADDPFLTPDGLTLVFDGPGATSEDVFSSTRANLTAAFPAPAVFAGLSTPMDESKASITGDGLDAFVASTKAGGQGGLDVWEATRPDTTKAFGMLGQGNLASVNTTNSEFDPAISFDGNHLYLAPQFSGTQHVAVATRGIDHTFGAPQQLVELADPGGFGDADPATSHDELVILFSTSRTGTNVPMGRNMWYATRDATGDTFDAPVLIPDVNTDDSDGGPTLSDDTCTLYFSSDRDGALHLWVATMTAM